MTKKTWGMIVVGGGALVAALGAIWWINRTPEEVLEVAAQLETVQQQAIKVGVSEPIAAEAPGKVVLSNSNAAPIYRRWIEDWNKVPVEDRQRLWKTSGVWLRDPETSPEDLIAALRKVPDPALQLRTAFSTRTCEFGYQFLPGQTLVTPELLMLERLARLEIARAKLALQTDQWESAMGHAENAEAILHHLGANPYLFVVTNHRRLEFMLWDVAISLVRMRKDDPPSRDRVRKMVERWTDRIRVEQIFRLASQAQLHRITLPDFAKKDAVYREAYRTETLQYWTRALEIVQNKDKDTFWKTPRLAQLDRGVQRDSYLTKTVQLEADLKLAFLYLRVTSMDAYLQLLLASLDMFDIKDRQGSYPETWKSDRRDIVGRGYVRYRRIPDGFEVISLGLDGLDDKGRVSYGDDQATGDIVLRDSPLPDDEEPAGFRRVLGKPLAAGVSR